MPRAVGGVRHECHFGCHIYMQMIWISISDIHSSVGCVRIVVQDLTLCMDLGWIWVDLGVRVWASLWGVQ